MAEENVFAFALKFHDFAFVTVGVVVVAADFGTVLLVALDWAMNLLPCLPNVPKKNIRFYSECKRGH